MLEILNSMKPFFVDCYRRISVREYARLQKISPPTASKKLEEMYKKGLLKKQKEKVYLYYFANKDSELFIDISRIYWKIVLTDSGFLEFLEKEFLNPLVVLFGSSAKAEVKPDSDIDVGVFLVSKKELKLDEFEKKMKRKIQLFMFKNIEEIKSEELRNNILNGFKLKGDW